MQKTIDELSTVRDFIRYAVSRFERAEVAYVHGAENAFDEAVFLILETLKLPIEELEYFLDAKLVESEQQELHDIIDKRIKTRKPSAYLVNRMYVQDYPFFVDERVNVPRPFLGEILLSDLIGGGEFNLIDDPEDIDSVLDLCTGAGCIPVVASHVFPNAKIDAIDISKDALEVAETNITHHKCGDDIRLLEGDLFKPVRGKKYDLITSSAPYLREKDLENLPPEFAHEPRRAIATGSDGLRIVKRIINSAADYLTENGILLCEVGENSRKLLEKEYPHLEFMWFETDGSDCEAFWLTYDELLF